MWSCDTCSESFYSEDQASRHMRANDHFGRFRCEGWSCTLQFRSQRDLNLHYHNTSHGDDFECETCYRVCGSLAAVRQHMDALDHRLPDIYCHSCKQGFGSANGLRMHLISGTHQGHQVPCPFCTVSFVSASGMLHHLETGSCSSAEDLDRRSLLRRVRNRDPNGLITPRQPPRNWRSGGFAEYNPFANEWRCSICARGFRTRTAAESHVNSPTHWKFDPYRCPNEDCERTFVSLAACFGHLESGSCGFMDFQEAQDRVRDVVDGSQIIVF